MDILYKVVCGSHLYGLNTPASDIDYGCVYMESMDQIFGIDASKPLPQIITDEKDENRHWLQSFAALCKRGNPNAIEWLWAPTDGILEIDPVFRQLILGNADAFLGLRALTASHFGFAKSQIGKMRPDNFVDAEKLMSERMRSKQGKVGQARRDLVEQHGYDTKYASHAVRLMIQLRMLVTTGKVIYPFRDEDRERIMGVKTGAIPNDRIDKILDVIKAECDIAVQENKAKIPLEADVERVNKALISFYRIKFE